MIDAWERLAFRERLWLCVIASALICALAAYDSGLRLHVRSYALLIVTIFVAGVSPLIRPDRFGRLKPIIEASDAILIFSVMGMIGAVASYVAMVRSGGMTDMALDRADQIIGFSWPTIRAAVDARPDLLSILTQAYSLCFYLPFLIVAMLICTGRSERLYDFLAAYGSSLILTIFIAFFFPAEAAFKFHDYANVPGNGLHYGTIIQGLRSGTFLDIDLVDLGGIVTFPSFHACMAILFVWATWPCRFSRGPMLILNGAMWAAAVPIGGHYVIDLLGGSIIAIVSISGTVHVRKVTRYPECHQTASGYRVSVGTL